MILITVAEIYCHCPAAVVFIFLHTMSPVAASRFVFDHPLTACVCERDLNFNIMQHLLSEHQLGGIRCIDCIHAAARSFNLCTTQHQRVHQFLCERKTAIRSPLIG